MLLINILKSLSKYQVFDTVHLYILILLILRIKFKACYQIMSRIMMIVDKHKHGLEYSISLIK